MAYDPGIIQKTAEYYSNKLLKFGNTPKGVDWKDQISQELRFQQLLKIAEPVLEHFSINDVGCGYGALFEYLLKTNYSFDYCGLDISSAMIDSAKELFKMHSNARFISKLTFVSIADYSVASGIFNVKMDIKVKDWEEHLLLVLHEINQVSSKGFSFNCLSKYSDKELMRNDLYYADPCFLFDYCKTTFSKHVTLLHDYGLYEFTILVRKF